MLLWLFIALCWLEGGFCIRYERHLLYRGIPSSSKTLWFFGNLTNRYKVVFWREPTRVYIPTEFSVAPEDVQRLLQDAKRNGVTLNLLIEDIQKAFDLQTVAKYVRRNMNTFNWKSYFKLGDIYSWYQDLVDTYPDIVKLIQIGSTYERRPIYIVRVMFSDARPRSRVIIEGGIHAREWISTAMATFLLNEIIIANNGTDKDLKEIAYAYEWHFIPVLNPDGYSYTHTVDRLWRKNRSQFNDGTGVDLNRNFNIKFQSYGCGKQTRDVTYCGPSAFSEHESRALCKYLTDLPPSPPIEYYIALHAYGQYLVVPYAYTYHHLDNFDEVANLCNEAKIRIAKRRATIYSVGNAYDTVGYLVGGVSSSWAKNKFNIPYVLTIELPDDGFYGFALPPHLIEPVTAETMDGLKYLLAPKAANVTRSRFSNKDDSCLDGTNGQSRTTWHRMKKRHRFSRNVFSSQFGSRVLELCLFVLCVV